MRGAVKELLSLGIENVQSLRIAGDAVALSDLARMKPPMHKSKVYGAVYAGLDLLGYQHNETGIMLSPDEYRALEEMIDQS